MTLPVPRLWRRRRFLAAAGLFGLASRDIPAAPGGGAGQGMPFGLVTYMWGAEWDVPALIQHCVTAGVSGVELRVDHAHRVDPTLSASERRKVKERFAESPVTVLGMGTNFEFHSPDPALVKKNIAGAREYVQLSQDIGGTGVKVKPNALPKEVAKEKTLTQIGRSLTELGKFAADFGQEIRLEVHGGVNDLGDIRTVMEVADRPNVRVCWNSNAQDLAGEGIEANFAMVRPYLGHTVHVHELNTESYPYATLARLLVQARYEGFVCLEASTKPADKVKALAEQASLWASLVSAATTAAP